MTGYVRKDTTNNIADGNVINSADLDNEFDGIQDAFNSSTGHNHDGTTGEGAPILVLGPTQDVVVGASAVTPKTTNTVDIGSGSLKFKDLYMAGNASIGGTLAVTGVATLTAQPILSSLTASKAVFSDASKGLVSNDITGTGNVVMSTSATLVTPILGTPQSVTLTNATGLPIVAGTTGTLSTARGGTGLTSFTANGVVYASSTSALTTGSALTFDGTNLGVGVVPTQTLNVKGIALFEGTTQGNVIIQKTGTNGFSLFSSAAGTLGFYDQNGGATRMILDASGLEIKQSQLIGYSSYAGIGTNGLAVAGNVGIGTSSPSQKLDVAGNVQIQSTGTFYLNNSDNTNQYYWQNIGASGANNATLILSRTNAGETLRIDSAGNLGLGVTPSAWGSSSAIQMAGGQGYSRYGVTNNSYYDGANYRYISTAAATLYGNNAGSHLWFTAASGTAGNAITFTQAMTLDASGNLGIGTTSPRNAGTGYQGIILNGTTSGFLDINTNGTRVFTAFGLTNDIALTNPTATGAMAFYTNNTERARIDSNGNLLVGTTSLSSTERLKVEKSNPTNGLLAYIRNSASSAQTGAKIAFETSGVTAWWMGTNSAEDAFVWNRFGGATYPEAMRLDASGNLLVGATSNGITDTNSITLEPTVSGGGYAVFNHATGSSSGRQFVYFAYGGGSIGSITQSGTTAVLYNVTSDQRLKENIVDAPEFGNVIDSIQVRSYDWKADGNHQRAGFVAQELVTVAPEAVHQPADPEEMMAVDYSKLVPMLVKEIQSLRKRLADAGIA